MRRKIAVVTGTRAEYGLLQPLLSLIRKDPRLELKLIVTGAHLSPAYGLTVREIEDDGFPIAARVDLGLGRDDALGIARAIARGVSGFAGAYARLKPDILVVLGDRYEILSAAAAALPFKLPVAHLHGGEGTEGVWDESIRHALTKLSHLHFPAAPAYARRILQMGEEPWRVHCFGSPGLDRIRGLKPLGKAPLEKELGTTLEPPVGIVTYHPETLGLAGQDRLEAMLKALGRVPGTWIITYPNADAGGRAVIARLKAFARDYRAGRARLYESLGQPRLFSLMRLADVMVGNSSSAILEAPAFRLPAVNIGDRQKARIRAGNVLDVPRGSAEEIEEALRRCLEPGFRRSMRIASLSPRASPSRRIVEVLRTLRLEERLIKKGFHAV